ncbi:PREDICTED: thyroid transcription factor 1-associated protein 26 [Buceros rhinoceros silvestris]|uniref:thyroid transcription factor 1-associated protein 26 n=1 Tax=Buceros rhinoceros silvestris TaxID=175836 RepID=UPI000528AA83|nr:PREDICTED: thyroid transcription factor 1-associated protein 26 [Buceros rhinoceros silvestris]
MALASRRAYELTRPRAARPGPGLPALVRGFTLQRPETRPRLLPEWLNACYANGPARRGEVAACGLWAARRGFAFRRKQKIERQYRKLLKKGRKVNSQQDNQFTDTYPEHLKHLYLAEEQRLKKRRRAPADSSDVSPAVGERSVMTEGTFRKKTSNQKAKEEYEKVKAERARKKEEAEKRKQQREAAQRLYKQKKMEAYKILSKKTKKGQPNLNLQVEFLLQKIQQNT